MAGYKGLGLSLAGITIGGLLVVYVLRRFKKRLRFKPLEVIVVTNQSEWDIAHEKLLGDLKYCSILGLDCEWVSDGPLRHPISMVQLSSLSGLCVLIRTQLLLKNEGSFPDTFKDILSDKRILKFGVAAVEDGGKLSKDYALECFGFVDLRNYVYRCTKLDIRPAGLKSLAKDVLGIDLNKDIKIRCGNWEGEILNESQLTYAALDCLVSLQIFLTLLRKNFGITVEEIKASGTEDSLATKASVLATCQGIVDLKFVVVDRFNRRVSENIKNTKSKGAKTTRGYEVRKSPLYHNSKLYSLDGTLLCTCDTKKARWFLEKNLAEKMSDDPLCVRLLFEPSGKPTSDTDYYLQEKENVCVVCGKPESYMRKFVIPHEYKKHLPTQSKEHKSHDVVLMCVHCHLLSDRVDFQLKSQLAQKYDAAIRSDKYLGLSKETAKVKSACLALNRDKTSKKIPTARVEELEGIIKKHFGVEFITKDILQDGMELAREKLENEEFEEHGQKVIRCILAEEDGIVMFERMWRQHFLDVMKPKFLPNYWSVSHGHDKMTQENKEHKEG